MQLRARAGALGALAFERLLPDTAPAVVNYHSVGVDGGCDNLTTAEFRAHVEWLDGRCDIVDLPAVLESESADSKRVAITFDDGLTSFYENAKPVLTELSAPATVFVPGAIVDGASSVSREQLAAERLRTPESLMSVSELRDICEDSLFTIGCHSMTHQDLSAAVDEAVLERELVASRELLEAELDTGVDRFAYPYHQYDERVRGMVADVYGCAVRNDGRASLITRQTDPYLVPRIAGGIALPALRVLVSEAGRRLVRQRRAVTNWRWVQ